MKKLCLFILSFTALLTAKSQVLYNQNFDQVGGPTAGGAGTYQFAPGFLLRNVDNSVPDVAVAYVNEAWERREDFANNVSDSAAFSTSWYAPVNIANDWMWTPMITLQANAILTWNAITYDAAYQDGYEVRIMSVAPTGGSGIIGNQITNSTVLFSTAAENSTWTARSAPLGAYAGQSVYIGFRNNSNNKFLLLIDDIKVEVQIDNDVQLLTTDTTTEYTQIPKTQVAPIVLGGAVRNNGILAQTNVTLTAKVFDQSNTEVYSATSTPLASLAPAATSHITIPSWTPPAVAQNYTIKLYADATQADQVLTNDTATRSVVVTESTYARDNGVVTGAIGIGAGNGGYLGQDFIISNTARVTSIVAFFNRGYVGKRYAAVIWDMVGGIPNQIVAKTDTLIYPDDSADFYIMPIDGGPFILNPGRYAVTAIEFDSTLALAQTSELFTTNRTWVDWPSNPFPGWANNEDFGGTFSKSYVIRPEILPLCPASVIVSSSFNQATCGNNDGDASVVVGAGTFTFDWSNGQSTATVSGLAPGPYTVNVTNTDLQCSQVVSFNITSVNGPTLVSLVGSTVDCFGDQGTATIQTSGGTGPFNIIWSDGTIGQVLTNTAGTYNVTVTDANNCVLNAGPVDIIAPSQILAPGTSTNETCPGCADGTASVNVSGGTPTYTYSWSPSGGSSDVATGLTGGTYTVTVTDDNDCEVTTTIVVGTSASIAENESTALINAYPNPNNGVFYVTSDIKYSGEALVEILDITGKVLYSKTVMLNNMLSNTAIHLDYTAAGTYMLRFTAGQQKFFRKLVIQ